MICPNCNTENIDTNRFCLKCGSKLPEPVAAVPPRIPAPVAVPARKPNESQTAMAITVGSVGIVSGFVILFCWLLPWFNLGGIVKLLLDFLDFGGFLGESILSRTAFTSGIGNGAQLTLLSVTASIAAFTSKDTIMLGFLCLVIAVILIAIPVLGAMNIRTGIKSLELRASDGAGASDTKKTQLKLNIKKIRRRSVIVFIIMIVIFAVVSIIPFGTGILSSGFFLMIITSLVAYVAAIIVQSQIRTEPQLE